ncbi:uncharacterized protein LOC125959493 [Anopheles darlingi]|uniref:uncharacterized protein LOC125959493 n=1 Tax=Anopheles darlingi TaxID=43151 RepID=UPI0021005629|nr:uncharacterized protein LOC125959493 [Anopheles darlingi]
MAFVHLVALFMILSANPAYTSILRQRAALPTTLHTPLGTVLGVVLQTEFLRPYTTTLVTLHSETVEGRGQLQDLLSELLIHHVRGQLVVQLRPEAPGSSRQWHRWAPPWTHCLLLAESYGALRTVYDRLATTNRYDVSGYYVIVLIAEETALATVNSLFNDLWAREIVNVVVAIRQAYTTAINTIQLWTYLPFSPGLCRVPKPVLLLNWPNDTALYAIDFFPRKNLRFHGCPLRVGTFETRPFTMLLPATMTNRLGGFEGDLLECLAQKLEFTVDLRIPPRAQQWGRAAFENSTGMMRMIYTAEVDFGIGCLGVSYERSAMLKAGMVHFTTTLVLVVPPGRPYSSFEKLFQPFRSIIWYVTLVYIVVGLLVSATLNRRSTPAILRRAFASATEPALNLVRVLFANPLPFPPHACLARTLLLLWINFCLVLQILYQGSLYRYLQRSSGRPPMATLAEIDQSRAAFHISDSARRYFEPYPHRLARLRYLPAVPDSIAARLRWVGEHPDDPDVSMCTRDHVAYHNMRHRLDGQRVRVARQPIALYTVTILYPKRSMLTPGFDDQIEQIVAAGLLKRWAGRYGDYRDQGEGNADTATIAASQPAPIHLVQLLGVFEVLVALLAFSTLVFIAERFLAADGIAPQL